MTTRRTAGSLRVLHVTEVLPGGVGSYIDDLASTQGRRNGRTAIAVLAPAQQIGVLRHTSTYSTLGYQQHTRGLAGLWNLRSALRRAVRDFAPDVVHLHSSLAGLIGRLPLALPKSEVRPAVIYTAHGWAIDPDRTGHLGGISTVAERFLAYRADRIVNISPHETRFLARLGFAEDRMVVVPTSLPTPSTPLADAPDREMSDRPIRLLFAGRIDHQKGLDRIWDEIVSDPRPNYRLRIAGTPTNASETSFRLPPSHVEMLGWVDRDQIACELAFCDALVMPSRWEGLPIIALEAMRAGRPIIASNSGPFPFMIDNGVDGALVDFDQPRALSRAVADHSPRTLARMGARAYARYVRDYDHARMIEMIDAVYLAALRDISHNVRN